MIRIGVSPFSVVADQCLYNFPNLTKECLKSPGINMEFISTVAHFLNIQFTIITTKVPGCGFLKLDANGSVEKATGLMQLLLDDDIDITGNLCSLDFDRYRALQDFGIPLVTKESVHVMKRPVPGQVQTNELTPFTKDTWCCCLATAAMLVLVIVLNLLKDYWGTGIWDLLRLVVNRITQFINTTFSPKVSSRSLTIVYITWLYFQLMVMFYQSKIRSVYVNNIVHKDLAPFRTTRELANSLHTGRLKFYSYHKEYRPFFTVDKVAEKLLAEAYQNHGFVSNPTRDSKKFYDQLLNPKSSTVPLIQTATAKYWLPITTAQYDKREQLLLVDSIEGSGAWLAHLWSHKFKYKEQFRKYSSMFYNLESTIRNRKVPEVRLSTSVVSLTITKQWMKPIAINFSILMSINVGVLLGEILFKLSKFNSKLTITST